MGNKEDYKIIISFTKDGNPFWDVIKKGEPILCNEEELELLNETFKELYEQTKKD